MSEFLYRYHPVEPSTWFYLSSLLLIGLYFKFGRFWSIRNVDLLLLMLLGPGLLFIYYGREMVSSAQPQKSPEVTEQLEVESIPEEDPNSESKQEANIQTFASKELTTGKNFQRYGFLWLFAAGGLLLARLLADPTMVRRPLLEPNLTVGGLAFIGCSLFVFLMANVIAKSPEQDPLSGIRLSTATDSAQADSKWKDGPGATFFQSLPTNGQKTLAIVAHLFIVVAMVLIGYWHFENIIMGVGSATLYLMLPYTTLMTDQVSHAVPACLVLIAILSYRRPLASGTLLALACGLSYYPFFLLPLWLSYYWPKGLTRFASSFVVALVLITMLLLMRSNDTWIDFCRIYGLKWPSTVGLGGIWDESINGWSPFYRIPMLAGFVVLAISMVFWPAQKNLGTLMSCSASIMIASQFWHGYGGGLFMAWYLPILLLTVFRPNLEDRIATTVVRNSWMPRRLRGATYS